MTYNTSIQTVCGVHLKLIVYTEAHFARMKAKRFLILTPDQKIPEQTQNIFIPNTCLLPDGTIQGDVRWIFQKKDTRRKLQILGYPDAPSPPDCSLPARRLHQIAFCALQLIRIKSERRGMDPKDTDDWLFSELDLEKSEIRKLFDPYGVPVYSGSAFDDGTSPKNYDELFFQGKRKEGTV